MKTWMSTMDDDDPATALVRRNDCIDLPPGTVVDEIYEIDAKLGAGAMGEVYAARHLKLGKRVAIKVIRSRLSEDAAAIERFTQEAQTLAKIQHPAIVAIDHVGELADGRAYFVMEYLRGCSLHARLTHGRLSIDEALRIIDQVARGLEAAHASGVTHRDLKPENTFLAHIANETAPIVKLLDFGLAKLAVDADHRAERTASGVAMGTPMYMSPEQARGVDVDHRTDIYALGCVAYELLLGRSPFADARSAPEFFAAHLHETPPLPRSIWPGIPAQLDLMLFAMVAKDPRHRPTLPQIRSVLATVATDRAAASPRKPGVSTERLAPKPRPRRLITLLLTVGAVLVGVSAISAIGGAVATRPSDDPVDSAMSTTPQPAITLQPRIPTSMTPKIDTPTATIQTIPQDADHPATAASETTEIAVQPNVSVRPIGPAIRVPHVTTSIAKPVVDAGVADAPAVMETPEKPVTPVIVDPPVHHLKSVPKQTKPLDRIVNPFAPKRADK